MYLVNNSVKMNPYGVIIDLMQMMPLCGQYN